MNSAAAPRCAVMVAALIAFGVGCTQCAKAPVGQKAPPVPRLYVTDEDRGTVSIIDPIRVEVVASIPVGERPRGIKLSRDGESLYVALSGSPPSLEGGAAVGGVGVVDLTTRKLVRTLPSGQDPVSFDLSPDGRTLYVSNHGSAEMTALDLPSGLIRGKVAVGGEPEGVAVGSDGKVVYVTSERDNEVTAVDTATLSVIAQMPTGAHPRSIVFAADGRTAFVTDEAGKTLTVLDTVAQKAVGDIALYQDSSTPSGVRPMGAVLSADGTRLYVSCGRGGSVAIVDVAARKQVGSLDGVGDRPWGIGLSRDGTRLYTANGTSHDVSIVNLVTGNVDKRVHFDGLPWGLVVGP